MTREKIILTDADGVLVWWDDAFNKFMYSKGYPRLPDTHRDYDIDSRHGISPALGYTLVKEFNEGPLIADLQPYADAVEYVGKLVNHGFRFIVITSLSNHPNAQKYREINLKSIFGNVFDEIHCLAMGTDKTDTLKRWKDSGYFWIEDHVKNAVGGHSVGLKSILITHGYNEDYNSTEFPIVSNTTPWSEIYSIIKSDYNL